MIANRPVRVGFVLVFAILLCGSSAVAFQSSKPENTIHELRAERVLFKTTLPVLPALADVNGDTLPDLFVGSKGHDFVSGEIPGLNRSGRNVRFKQLSIHLNRLQNGPVEFADPFWLTDKTANADLPDG